MKTVLNKTRKPIQVPLPRGKILHLGPLKSGKISHKDLDHEPLQRLIKQGAIAIEGDSPTAEAGHEHDKGAHPETHGHQPPTTSHVKGDR